MTESVTEFLRDEGKKSAFLGHIIMTALEGGIQYWGEIGYQYEWAGREDDVVAHVIDDDDGRGYEVNIETIRRGISLILIGDVKYNADLRESLFQACASRDAGEIDQSMADDILQAGLFREIPYC